MDAALQFNHLRFSPQSWMLHFGYKTSRGGGGGGEEQGGGGGGGLKNLPQFRLLQSRLTGSNSGSRCLNPAIPAPVFPYTTLNTPKHGDSYLSRSAAGSRKHDGKSTTSHGLSSCGRWDSLLPTRRGQVHPHILRSDRRAGGDRGGNAFSVSPFSQNHFGRSFPLGYSPPWLVSDQTITFHRVLNNEKRWVFLFCCRRTHPSGWLCPVWPQRERPSRLRGPASLPPHNISQAGGEEWIRAEDSPMLRVNTSLCSHTTMYIWIEVHKVSIHSLTHHEPPQQYYNNTIGHIKHH